MRLISLSLCTLTFALSMARTPAVSEEISSAYEKLDVRRDCKHKASSVEEDYGSWRCAGYAGVPMWLSAGDQRMYVSFGPKADNEPAASQTLAPFNDFYKGVVEFRQTGGKPFATIIRWNYKHASEIDKRTASGRLLVVTRLPPGPVCHVGYVDALANRNANELAREIADTKARGFDCGKDKPNIAGKVTAGDAILTP